MAAPRLLDEDLLRAAEILEREAELIRDSYTLGGRRPRWDPADRSAKADHDEMLRLARRFRKVVGKL